MADGNPIRIGQNNNIESNNPGTGTVLGRAANSLRTDPVFTVRTPVGGDGIHGEASSNRTGVQGTSASGNGVQGTSASGPGVDGRSTSSFGVQGTSSSGIAVRGRSIGSGVGVRATSGTGVGMDSFGPSGPGVSGGSSSGVGIDGLSDTNVGVQGTSINGSGVHGTGASTGVIGNGAIYFGVFGRCPSGTGVFGSRADGPGVSGGSANGTGVRGNSGTPSTTSSSGVGVFGTGPRAGVQGESGRFGVHGRGLGFGGIGVFADAEATAVHAQTSNGIAIRGIANNPGTQAGEFQGNVSVVNGDLTVSGDITSHGNKPFKIDHPLDPQNKYLLHNAVESSERKNVYDGVAQLAENGAAWVELPEWFEALNGDFRYQLTAVGGSAPDLHVAEEVSENRFKIAGGEEGMKVCWQVTGSRKDPWAAANPFEVEQEKPEEERGRYLEPSLYGAPEEQSVMIGPRAEAVEEEQRPPQPSGIDFARLEEEELRRLEEWRRIVEEQRRELVPPSFDYVRLEEEGLRRLEEWRRIVEEQRRELEEEAPPEST
jgi:hypothetical protein